MHWTASAPPHANRPERKQGCSPQEPVNRRLWAGQRRSSSTAALARRSPEVQPHLAAAVSPARPPRSGPAPAAAAPRAAGSQRFPEPAAGTGGLRGVRLTAKPPLALTHMGKRSGNVSFGSPAGHSHFSISQQVSPACLPILSNPVKLITKHLQRRAQTFTANTLLVWLAILLIPRLAQRAACCYYSLGKGSRSFSPPVGPVMLTSLLPDITGTRGW